MKTAEDFWSAFFKVRTDVVHDNIDFLIFNLDDLFLEEEFQIIDDIIRTLELEKLCTSEILSVLTMVSGSVSELPSLSDFIKRVRSHLEETRPSNVDELLTGFSEEQNEN